MKNIIDKLNLNCKQFSELYEIPYMTVNQWYNGKRTPPKWVVKLFNELIESKKNGEQITIEDKYIYLLHDEKEMVGLTFKTMEELLELVKKRNKIGFYKNRIIYKCKRITP